MRRIVQGWAFGGGLGEKLRRICLGRRIVVAAAFHPSLQPFSSLLQEVKINPAYGDSKSKPPDLV